MAPGLFSTRLLLRSNYRVVQSYSKYRGGSVCRSIKVLRKPEPVTPEELDAAALQFVRKISGFHKPSQANQKAFQEAVVEISSASERLLESLTSAARRTPESAGSAHPEQSPPCPATAPHTRRRSAYGRARSTQRAESLPAPAES